MSAPATPPTPASSRPSTPDPSGPRTGKIKGLFRKSRKFFHDLGTSSKAKGKAVDAAEVPPTPAGGAVNDSGEPDPPTESVHSPSTGGETKEKLVSAAETVVRVAAGAVGDAGVPGLAGGLSVVAEVLKKFRTMGETVKGVSSLNERIERLAANLEQLKLIDADQPLSEDRQRRLSSLIEKWTTIWEGADRITQRGSSTRFIMSGADAKELKDLLDEINTSIQDFMLCEVVDIGGKLYYVYEAAKAIQANIDAGFMPIYAKRAQYDASRVRRPCLEGTRVVILAGVFGWILDSDAQDSIVYWVCGLAGTGKTTIAYSVALWCKRRGILGASFFFSRQDAECRDPELIFVTICRQLCQFHAPFKAEVTKVLQKDPSVIHSSPTEQFEKLILEPLEALQGKVPKMVIVFDALDECEGDGDDMSTTLTVLATFAPRIAQRLCRSLTFVLTGRPKRQVTALFEKSRPESLHNTTQRLLLHMVKLELVKDDIRRCIEEEFKTKAGVFEVEEDWPSEENKDELADLSGGLFILATTAVRYILDTEEAGVPQERMDTLLRSRSSSQTPQAVLEVLYTKIAEAASPRTPAPASPLHHAIGTIALAREPLSSTTLGGILGMSTANARNTLIGLHSVLHIPHDHDEAIRIIHPTFPEFLLATHLEKPADFCITVSEQHAFLFERNLQIMKALKRNIAGFPSHLQRKDAVLDLKTDLKHSILPYVSYAVRHWTAHLGCAVDSCRLADASSLFHEFLHQRLLQWLEVSSLLDALEGAAAGLNVARIACRRIGAAFAVFVPLLADSRRFALTYFACIDDAPLELYYSALAFAPDQSLVKQLYLEELRGAPISRCGVALDWEPCIKTFGTYVNWGATCIDFSPDRSVYVDHKSRICNVTTQKVLTTLDLRDNGVMCAAFCPDGQHVAMVSSNWHRWKTLDVWHLTSGERVHSFEGHSNYIKFVTYSTDGRRILSADKHEVRLWSASDRQSLLTLPWDLKLPWGIALSPDGSVIALPDPVEDHLCLYSTASQTSERLSLPGKMRTAAFSLDGRYVAASTDTTITVWTLADRSLAHSLDVPAEPYRLAFSTDSTRLGCGLDDGSVCLWQVGSSGPPVVLHGHGSSVYNVIWSLDDSQIISFARLGDVRIWDATRSPVAEEQPQQPTDIISLPDSPCPTVLCKLEDGLHIFHLPGPAPVEPFCTPDDAPTMTLHADIAEAWDAALSTEPSHLPDADELSCARDWELLTGQRHIFSSYPPVTLSQDATFMAFRDPSDDKTVRVCNLHTGDAVAALSCHNTVRATAFSPDGSLLATGSDDEQVRVWDIATQRLVDSHTTHTSLVLAVAFCHGGQLIASGGRDGVVCLYDLATRCTLHTLTFRSNRLWDMRITFSADDAHVIALDDGRHALIGDVATGAIIHQVSLGTDAWTRTLDFTPDYAGLLVHAEDGQVHKINMEETGPRIWPVYHVSDDGWVTEKSPGRRARRVCWLPPEWRGVFSLGGPLFCALDKEGKRSVVIDVSEVESLELSQSLEAATHLNP